MAEPSMRVDRLFSPIMIILALAAFLLLFGLDNRPFWQDEAETAGLAKNVLTYGVPRAYDGLNIISQERGSEFDGNFLWRWSPWLQIYVAAAAFRLGGLTTFAGRLPFALAGLACIFLVYQLVRRNLGDRTWALCAAALLTCSVPFLLYARQCRYYSLGAFFTLMSLYAFKEDWQSRFRPALLLCLSIGFLFYTNYLLFFSYVMPTLLVGLWLYPGEFPLKRTTIITIATLIIIVPGLFLFRIQEQSHIINLAVIPNNLENYFRDLVQYMIPLPIAAYLLWRWRRFFWTRAGIPGESGEKFILFLGLIILGNIIVLSLAPQCEHRYLVHLYPLCAIILGWVILKTWRYHKISGVLLAFLLFVTNWLYLVPMDWLQISNRPNQTNRQMLTYPNLPLRLFLTELFSPYADVNRNFIRFFQTQARPGDLILTTYGDLPLQFYTPFQVIGGLQGKISPSRPPDWVVSRYEIRYNRNYQLQDAEKFIREKLSLTADYQAIILPWEDEPFGNRPDPYYHRFVPATKPLAQIVIYKKLTRRQHVP
ncbi:MAG: glycosyltransferase family 39 protein [Deltaproteobacteria bacterium]|nr:glycosyltransferase family 39 protein [Deltaproteobacteria bacterium]